jgi:large subunit ribosomal protein L4
MQLQIRGASEAGSVDVADAAFGREFNEPLVHQVVTAYLAGGRAGTKAQKSRAEVVGGGTKPWRQKGMGRARAGSIRSPLWRGGGRSFAARPRDYDQKVNRKMYRGAMRAILSELVRQERLVVLDELTLNAPKTKALVAKLKALGLQNALILVEDVGHNLSLAARNLSGVAVRQASAVDPVSLIGFEKVIATVAAIRHLNEWLAHE